MKKWQKNLIIVVVVLFILNIIKDPIIQTVITGVGSNVVGAPVKLSRFSLGLFSQKVRLKGLRLYNPPGFPKETLVDIPEIGVDYDLGSFLKGKLHLPLVIVDVKEMTIIRNEKGEFNVDSLKVVEEQKAAAKKKDDKSKKDGQIPPFHIDVMKLNIGRVVYKDYSQGGQPVVQVYDVALKDKKFEDISSVEQMITIVMVQGMGPAAIKGAAVYGAATILGVGFLPVGVAAAFMGKADAAAEYNVSYSKAYDIILKFLQETSDIKSEDKTAGVIKSKKSGCDLTVKIDDVSGRKVLVTVEARQLMLPKSEIASGIIYQLNERLK